MVKKEYRIDQELEVVWEKIWRCIWRMISEEGKGKKYKHFSGCTYSLGRSMEKEEIYLSLSKHLTDEEWDKMSKREWKPVYKELFLHKIIVNENKEIRVIWKKREDLTVTKDINDVIGRVSKYIENINYKKIEINYILYK